MANGSNKNDKTAVLATLAEHGDPWTKFGTLILVALSGVGNCVSTWKAADSSNANLDQLRAQVQRQVQDIHTDVLNNREAVQRNFENSARSRAAAEASLESAREEIRLIKNSLDNQEKMLENQQHLLIQMRRGPNDGKPPAF